MILEGRWGRARTQLVWSGHLPNYTAANDLKGIEVAALRESKLFKLKRILVLKMQVALYNLHEETHGRRYITYVQRLRAGLYLHRC
jgi:hypothetical protein